MSSNSTAAAYSTMALFVAYYPLSLMTTSTICNILIFAVLCRPKFRDTNERPTLHYMRALAIVDIFMLYGWSLDHYLWGIHGYTLRTHSIPTSLSRLHRTWFGHSKNVLSIIACIFLVLILFNLHIVIFGCFYEIDGSINLNSRLHDIYPFWPQVNLIVYNYIPFVCIIILNSMVIYYLLHRRRTTTVANSRIPHRSISITLLITIFLFLIMTTPGNIGYSYFYSPTNEVILNFLDVFLYIYHSLSIVLHLITFYEFRHEFIDMIRCKNSARMAPLTTSTRRVTALTGNEVLRKSRTISIQPVQQNNRIFVP